MYLLRLPNYYTYLEEPIIGFISELNSIEDEIEVLDLGAGNLNEDLR